VCDRVEDVSDCVDDDWVWLDEVKVPLDDSRVELDNKVVTRFAGGEVESSAVAVVRISMLGACPVFDGCTVVDEIGVLVSELEVSDAV
jgi:hypothetical protein